jgi:hypothetical protein
MNCQKNLIRFVCVGLLTILILLLIHSSGTCSWTRCLNNLVLAFHILLSLCLSPSNFKKGYIISAVFEILMFNHSNGAYFGCQGSLPNSFFHPESNYYKLHEHIQVKFSKCDMELVGTDLIMCIKLLLLRLNVMRSIYDWTLTAVHEVSSEFIYLLWKMINWKWKVRLCSGCL